MEKNKHKIILLCFGIMLFLFSGASCLAAALEVDYPLLPKNVSLSSGATITQYINYLINLGMFLGFLATAIGLIVGGSFYIMSSALPSLREKAKDRIFGAISGFLIVILTYLILTTINPQFAGLQVSTLPPVPAQQANLDKPGVYFFNNAALCNAKPLSSQNLAIQSAPDLGALKNKVRYIRMISDPSSDLYYMTILYEQIDYKGRCEYYYESDNSCQNVEPFANSAGVYSVNLSSGGSGVTIYRNPLFDDSGGSLDISNQEISSGANSSGAYIKDLESMTFEDQGGDCSVPEQQQDCVEQDFDGNCLKWQCPNLAKNNIGSIRINGDYLVLLTYVDDSLPGKINEKLARCQAYPSPKDENKIGPLNIKWDYINAEGKYPNYIFIFPI